MLVEPALSPMALRLTNLGGAPFGGRCQPRNAPLNAVVFSLEKLNAQFVDFVAHCVSCYAFDECGARNRASRSTKYFSRNPRSHPASRWQPTAASGAVANGIVPRIHSADTASMVFQKTIAPAQAAGGKRWIARAWAVDARRRASTSCVVFIMSSIIGSSFH